MKSAMMTIEIIISMLIIFMVIGISAVSVRKFYIIKDQQQEYEKLYIAVLNIKDSIEHLICKKKMIVEGNMLEYSYTATCRLIQELRSYKKKDIDDKREGNIGNMVVKLYTVELVVQKEKIEKKFVYYKTIEKRDRVEQ